MKNIAINIMTKLMVVILGLFISGSVLAQNGNVREETARQVGLNFLRLKDGNLRSDLQLTRVDAVQYPNLYVYNTSENGFIVVASDNRLEPILAYSDEGTFDKDNVAPGANFWFEMYEYAIDSIVRNNVRDVDEKIAKKWEDLKNGVLPEPERNGNYPTFCGKLIMTNWDQGYPFNKLCPWYEVNGNKYRALTGCVATAMAQVLNYKNVNGPQQSTIFYSFRHNSRNNVFSLAGIDGVINHSEEIDGCYLPPRKRYSFGGWTGNDRVAKMMLDCGLAVDMVYGVGGKDSNKNDIGESGAYDLDIFACANVSSEERALRLYFGFPKAFGKLRSINESQWTDTLKKYICHNIPVLYGGYGSKGRHEFICDGYDEWNLFHFNFGWGGKSDGNYSINTINTIYPLYQSAVFLRPVPDEENQEIIWNDVIAMGDSLSRSWCGGTVAIKPGTSPSSNTNWVIVYNSPGSYSLRNECNDENRTLLWNVKVSSPQVTIYRDSTICRRDNFNKRYKYIYQTIGAEIDSAFAYYNLSRDQTDFSGSKDFYEYFLNSEGEPVAVCKLKLTTSGIVSADTIPVTVNRCDLDALGYMYRWGINDTVILCEYSGVYEYVFEGQGPLDCDYIVCLDLTIEGDEIIEDTTVCKKDSIEYHGKWITKYDNMPYKVCDNGVFYELYANFTDSISINVSDAICVKNVPYTWRDTTFSSWTIPRPEPYHAEITVPSNCNCCCDTTFVIDLQINEDCCVPDTACIKDEITGDNKSTPSNMEVIYYGLKHYYDYRGAMNGFLANVLRGVSWTSIEERNTFWNLFQSLLDTNTAMMSEEATQQLIATNPFSYVSGDYIADLVERYNCSVMYWNEGYYSVWYLPEGYNMDFIEYDTVSMNKAYEAYDYAIANGFSDVRAMYDNAYELLAAEVDNIQSSVCSKVTVQFNQKMTMTREAFNGTLQIFNGHESIPMEDIFVDFRIEDQQGNNCTDLFQINTLSLDQITGISGDGSLAAQTNGTALVQFIPTKNAAPTQPVVYSFGGSFSFIDPFTGEGLTYPLHPVDITVNPSPDLYVDIMMQRDILGDDALTLGVVEPSVPAELGVIIHNQGAGTAKNVILETAEPQIIDNEKGLAVSFGLYDASFNGSPRQLGLHDISFGNIESGLTAVGEWRFTSSLLGHFVSYQANLIHNSSYGNPDLSLVSHLDIHELIHPIYAYGNLDDGINDFLVNDNPDAYDTPDSIYFSHGGKTSVGVADDISFDHYVSPSDTIVTLTVEPSRIGWNYGVTDDPGMNQYDIVSCIRNNDNQVIPLNNVWLTFVTIPDGGDPVYENKLHIVDTFSVQQTTTYTLVFRRKPSNLRIFNGNENEYWSNAANWEGNVMPQDDDEVLINGICLLDEDVEVFSLTVAENQSLTIPVGRILTTSGTLTSEATSRLVIQDGGQLVHKNVGVQATVQKDIEPYTNNYDGYYLIATPLAGFTAPASVVNMLSNDYDLYYFDQSQELEWINYEGANGNYELVPGKGYLYANSEGVVLEFAGELRSGATTLTVPLIYTEGAGFIGFNLVGNPFVYNLTTYASHNVAEGCYRMNEAKDDLMVSEISESNPLKPAEGFFVKATDEGAYITFNPQMTSMAPRGSINVELSDNGLLIDRLIVKTDEGRSLEKFNLKATRSKLFAQDKRHEYAIVPCESHEQPVSFKAAKSGTYTINVNADRMEFYYLHLIDNLTGNDVDLLTETNYTFDARTTDYASRFLLRFIPKDDTETGSGIENFAYNFNGTWIIANEGDATLQVVDMMGHVLSSERINGTCEKQMDVAAGVYLLRLINGNSVKVQKIVVKQ